MKYFVLLSLILLGCSENKEQIVVDTNNSHEVSHQKTDEKIEIDYDDIINTDTTILSTGSMIYWQYNKDSSWLTFETKQKEKKILNTMYDNLMGYTHRLGIQFIDEYPNYAFFIEEVISGCCTPPNLIFLDKKDGKKINTITSNQVIPNSDRDSFCTYFNDNYDSIVTLDLARNKRSFIEITDSSLIEYIKSYRSNYPHQSIKEVIIQNDSIIMVMDSTKTIIKEKLHWN